MRINSITASKADITMDANELVTVANVLYFYENHWQDGHNQESPPGERFHTIAKQIITARDLCQYGHLDSHALGLIMKHETAAHPDGGLSRMLHEQAASGNE